MKKSEAIYLLKQLMNPDVPSEEKQLAYERLYELIELLLPDD